MTHARQPETDDQRRQRHLDMLRDIAELGMQLAVAAAARALEPEPGTITADPAAPSAPDATLAFARATSAVRQAIALEARIAAGTAAPGAKPEGTPKYTYVPKKPDPRRPLLQEAFSQAVKAETDRAARKQLQKLIDDTIDAELEDPDVGMVDLLDGISAELGIKLDLSKLRDEVIGMPPRVYLPDFSPSGGYRPPEPDPVRNGLTRTGRDPPS